MRTITATELRQKLGEILDAASIGEQILIERDHRPLAFLVSYEEGIRMATRDDEKVQRQLKALDELVEFSKAWRLERGDETEGMSAAEWIRWDRDHRDDEKWERSFGSKARAEREARRGEPEELG